MVARANIAVADGESSPATHTFTPNGDGANGVFAFRNLNATTPAASETITMSQKDSASPVADVQTPAKKVSPNVTEFRLRYPATYVDAVSGLTLVDYTDEAIVTFNRHPRSTEQRGENIRKMVSNLLADAVGTMVTYAIDKGEKVW
jgi:hypothetical protein